MGEIFRPKFLSLLKIGISKRQIGNDILAGIVVGVIALPLAIAFAVASGVSPEKGIITSIIAGFIISLLGGSRVQIGGPTGAFIVIVFGIVQKYGVDGLIISTILAGLILIGFGLLKLGGLLKFFPFPLVVGFTSGIAIVIFSTQIKDAFGLEIDKIPSGFIEKWSLYFAHLHDINPMTVGMTMLTIIIILFSTKVTQKIPGPFIAIMVVTLAVQLFHIPVTTIGTFFNEIPHNITFTLPHVEWSTISQYFAPALIIALLGSIESLLSAVVADGMIGGHHRSNTELIAQGIANIITPFFGGIPATGAIARTATNVKNGGRTPIAGMTHAVILLLIMIFFGKWAKLIPMSCLAGILMVVSYNMSEWRSFRAILRGSYFEIVVLLTTFLLTVFVDLTAAIEIGIVLSSLLFMKRMADLGSEVPPPLDSDLIADYSNISKGISIYEMSGPLFFGSAKQYMETLIATGYKCDFLVIRMRHVPFIDSTGLSNLKGAIKALKNNGITIVLSGVNQTILKDFYTYHIVDLIGEENIFETFKSAIEYTEDQQQLLVKN